MKYQILALVGCIEPDHGRSRGQYGGGIEMGFHVTSRAIEGVVNGDALGLRVNASYA